MAEFASKGVAGSGLGLGIAGTALGLLNGAGGLFNAMGNGVYCAENAPVNRYEMTLAQEVANKDAHIRLLEAQVYTDQKIVSAVEYLQSQIKELGTEVRSNKNEQNAINLNQAVYNGTNTATIGCIQAQVAALQGLTKLVVPNTSVCPGWGNVTITPAAATTTG